jgi:hypothetical protein
MGQGKDEVGASPAEIRKAIAEARSDLGAHLGALNPLNLLGVGESPGDTKMPTVKKSGSSKGAKTAARKSEPKKPDSKAKAAKGDASKNGTKAKKHSPKTQGVAAKAGAVLDTMAAGAVVGAVKAAAHAIDENEVQALKGSGKKSPSTSAVLGDLAPDAAMGALVGAAQSVLPPVEEKPEGKVAAKTKPKAANKSKS